MVDLNKINEKFMWEVELNDGIKVDEFYINNSGEISETPFNIINKNDNYKKLSLVSSLEEFKDLKISVDNNGEFIIDGNTCKFVLELDNGTNILNDEKFNSLMMYRQSMMLLTSNKSMVSAYVIGYKIDNDDIFARIKLINSIEGCSFKLEITGKKEFTSKLLAYANGKLTTKHTLKIEKDNTININIK